MLNYTTIKLKNYFKYLFLLKTNFQECLINIFNSNNLLYGTINVQ
jgi:hypothetical protein